MAGAKVTLSEKEVDFITALVNEGIEVLEALKEHKLTAHGADRGDIGRGFEDFLMLCGDEEREQMVLEGVLVKLKGGEM